MRKSYKREVAGACLVFTGLMVSGLYLMTDVEKIKALVPLATGLGGTVVVMALMAFGLHHWKPPA